MASLLNTKYKTQKTLGNLNNHIGTPLTILNLDEDTEMTVIEMGTDNFGQISLLTSIVKPDVAMITNIGEAHLEGLKTKENIAKAKLEILEGLNKEGIFIYYGDDLILSKIIKEININQRILTYGIEKTNDYRCELNMVDENGISFKLKSPYEQDYFLPMLGSHNMLNATGAIAIARYFNIPMSLSKKVYTMWRKLV
ncbi:Mur ligase-like protein [Keratinibaculum paraultunense]|uniref:Mur ligase-like protein n=1 Tax=Keratinibaculum paraultunense TaxID=1278232 RepID=A0A4R3KS99_9FIRM|nr:Mur ligase family protein [Keratinibaculum paraultunense]QQY79609.1 hypothetical protein JL105_10535 [Keratinibaculum paraultunense]TCS87636.1 Mur ligase-like protein [Keratinibaculum paraultunense]